MRKTLMIALGAAVALVDRRRRSRRRLHRVAASAPRPRPSRRDKARRRRTSRTCTGADGKAFTVTSGRYTGTADFTNAGAPSSTAPLTIDARTTVYSTTDGARLRRGLVPGQGRRHAASHGTFIGTLEGTGKLAGFLDGVVPWQPRRACSAT